MNERRYMKTFTPDWLWFETITKFKPLFLFVVLFLLFTTVTLFAGTDPVIYDVFGAARGEHNLPLAEGFGALKWGVSVEEAHRFYPDLREKETDKSYDGVHVDYRRDNEDLRVSGYQVEYIKYSFLEGKFYSVGISIECSDYYNPYNIDKISQDIEKALRNLYGKPYDISSSTYVDTDLAKKKGGVVLSKHIKWEMEDESISITKHVEPKSSYILISIFSYQGYFEALGQER